MHFMYPETQIRPLIPMYQGKLHVHFSENRIAQDLNLEGITYLSLDRKKKKDTILVYVLLMYLSMGNLFLKGFGVAQMLLNLEDDRKPGRQ